MLRAASGLSVHLKHPDPENQLVFLPKPAPLKRRLAESPRLYVTRLFLATEPVFN